MWTLTEAKAKLSEVADLAINEGPQEITVATKEPVVLIRKADLEKLTPGGVAAFFNRAPKLDDLAEVFAELERE
jgi:prevent-host-death family protein